MSFDYEVIAMSFHEASHVICGLFNCMKIDDVYVMSDKHKSGKTSYEIADINNFELKPLVKTLLIYEIQALYAGLVGEKIYYKEICGSDKFPMHLRIGSSGDIAAAAELISSNNLAPAGKSRLQFKRQIQTDAFNILTFYWEDVRLMAHQLYRYKRLSYEEIRSILVKYSLNKEQWKLKFKQIKIIYDNKAEVNQDYLSTVFSQ